MLLSVSGCLLCFRLSLDRESRRRTMCMYGRSGVGKACLAAVPDWVVQRQLRKPAGKTWGDVCSMPGGKTRKNDSKRGHKIHGNQCRRNMDVMLATIRFLKSIGKSQRERRARTNTKSCVSEWLLLSHSHKNRLWS